MEGVNRSVHFGGSINRGPQNRSQCNMILLVRTPKKGLCLLETAMQCQPNPCFGRLAKRSSQKRADQQARRVSVLFQNFRRATEGTSEFPLKGSWKPRI